MGQRIAPVSCLNFHPFKLQFVAAGASDNIISIYHGVLDKYASTAAR